MLWKPVSSGHELNAMVTGSTELFFEAVASGKPCMLWGEDDTMPFIFMLPFFVHPSILANSVSWVLTDRALPVPGR